jgi:hypothetical protein
MATWTPDPTFYPSPRLATQAPASEIEGTQYSKLPAELEANLAASSIIEHGQWLQGNGSLPWPITAKTSSSRLWQVPLEK